MINLVLGGESAFYQKDRIQCPWRRQYSQSRLFLYSVISIFKDTQSRWAACSKVHSIFLCGQGSIASGPSFDPISVCLSFGTNPEKTSGEPISGNFMWTDPIFMSAKLTVVMNRGQVWHKWHGRRLKVCKRM